MRWLGLIALILAGEKNLIRETSCRSKLGTQ
jgi:hypothetical protein